MEIDVQIERIDNGFIVTANDSTKSKRFYPSMEAFAESQIIEPLRDADKYFKEHAACGELRKLTLRIDDV